MIQNKLLAQTSPALFVWHAPKRIHRLYDPAFDVKGITTDMNFFTPEKCLYLHFVPQVGQTCFLWIQVIPFQRSTEPNKPLRISALLRTLLPQLFAQFDSHSERELFELLNTQSEAAGVNQDTRNATDLTLQPIPIMGIFSSYNMLRLYSFIFSFATDFFTPLPSYGRTPPMGENFILWNSPPLGEWMRQQTRGFHRGGGDPAPNPTPIRSHIAGGRYARLIDSKTNRLNFKLCGTSITHRAEQAPAHIGVVTDVVTAVVRTV